MLSKITCYLDCGMFKIGLSLELTCAVSPYSYFALLYLEKNKQALTTHNVEIDIIPVFLGGINVGSGNKPPWTLPAKAAYSGYDSARAKKYFGAEAVKTPDFFPIMSLLPQRALCFVKEQYPDAFVSTFLDIFEAMWKNGKDVSKSDTFAETLQLRFSSEEAKVILSSAISAPFKQRLNENTKEALDRGAFGAPWFWVRNAKGAEEPFFGSDRFHYMWEYLGLPWKDMELVPHGPPKAKI
ncbi:glutathione S-transferase kappa 1 [Didymella exigua CBS 183.55]|uniref:Glutathione S-transferase kappa n=1 Tax=Didymella exigua CBS 183.55 TaxID=1150837 RepID=A0A6A5S2A1_9PLEO|nr:glutathione S-transferase kappa 1 [Didymella exigua CBS 183.55]KAF1934033.1 glutathione S-transferase kappa 1 [Didymella exigua CBS 183.55]